MPCTAQLRRHAIYAAIMAALYVTVPQPLLGLSLVIWVASLGINSIITCLRHGATKIPAHLAVHFCVWLIIVSLAEVLPVKTRERYLERTVVLPTAEMSLKELKTYVEGQGRDRFPVPVEIEFPESQAERVIRWSSRTIKLREFLSRIEEQSSLESRLWGCGNSRTILWGIAPDELCLTDPYWSE